MLNLLPRRVVELLDGADQAHVAVGDQLEEVVRRPDVPLGDRDDQPEVGPDDLVLDGQGLFLELARSRSRSAVFARAGSMRLRGACWPCYLR